MRMYSGPSSWPIRGLPQGQEEQTPEHLFDDALGETCSAGMYACRPPGMPHGPWRSEDGCRTFEIRYYRH
jgi:hypothetical protein